METLYFTVHECTQKCMQGCLFYFLLSNVRNTKYLRIGFYFAILKTGHGCWTICASVERAVLQCPSSIKNGINIFFSPRISHHLIQQRLGKKDKLFKTYASGHLNTRAFPAAAWGSGVGFALASVSRKLCFFLTRGNYFSVRFSRHKEPSLS